MGRTGVESGDLARRHCYPDARHQPYLSPGGGEDHFGYDWETLELVLRAARFSRVERMSFGRSLDPELAIDGEVHSRYSLYVDAVK